ncbi:rRNA 2'-O-methyltransferase fibrillarin-like [Ananas comosus]|uniref:rRNA 2'-O-methyltransferase fibrillarin-like n=1 Tax=Ananas comosus TaxID=4615 RepID=A0A6P5GMI9_ANACO|nr:rRNA 2'-O-methyltransferase fibrillarin-like [Ananas comosus]
MEPYRSLEELGQHDGGRTAGAPAAGGFRRCREAKGCISRRREAAATAGIDALVTQPEGGICLFRLTGSSGGGGAGGGRVRPARRSRCSRRTVAEGSGGDAGPNRAHTGSPRAPKVAATKAATGGRSGRRRHVAGGRGRSAHHVSGGGDARWSRRPSLGRSRLGGRRKGERRPAVSGAAAMARGGTPEVTGGRRDRWGTAVARGGRDHPGSTWVTAAGRREFGQLRRGTGTAEAGGDRAGKGV